jgi:hypothetical protein
MGHLEGLQSSEEACGGCCWLECHLPSWHLGSASEDRRLALSRLTGGGAISARLPSMRFPCCGGPPPDAAEVQQASQEESHSMPAPDPPIADQARSSPEAASRERMEPAPEPAVTEPAAAEEQHKSDPKGDSSPAAGEQIAVMRSLGGIVAMRASSSPPPAPLLLRYRAKS